MNHTWQADLIDMRNLKRTDKGYQYMITCIDVFSKVARVVPLKDKTGKRLLKALKLVFKTIKPKHLQTDKGTEFLNEIVVKYLKSINVNLYQVNSDKKACIVERFNRTYKEKMWRYFTSIGKYIYYNIIDKLVDAYNNTYP